MTTPEASVRPASPKGPGVSPGIADPSEATAPPPAPARVVVRQLEKVYGTRRALAGVSFELGNGLTGLLGPNGAGKSTLMRCLAGISSWDQGRVVIDGIEAERHPRSARRHVGFMPERVAFPGEMRVDAYLDFVAAAKGMPRSDHGLAVELALLRGGLEGVRRRVIGNLSKGYRQRVGLAQALLGDPPVVVLDEPMAGLDPLNLLDVRAVLSDYARDHAVLLSTHTLPEARLLCERLIVLGAGAIVYDGVSGGMTLGDSQPRQIRVHAQGGDAEALAAVVGAQGGRVLRSFSRHDTCDAVAEVPGEEAVAALARHLVTAGWSLLALEPTADHLEEAFRQAVLRNQAVVDDPAS